MNSEQVVSKMNGYLHLSTEKLAEWLSKWLPKATIVWWDECVLGNLTNNQYLIAKENNYSKLQDFDLAALLRIADKSWYTLKNVAYMPTKEREVIRDMKHVRNNWAHCSATLPGKDMIIEDINTLVSFFGQMGCNDSLINELNKLAKEVKSGVSNDEENTRTKPLIIFDTDDNNKDLEIKEKSRVRINATDEKGMVVDVIELGDRKKYTVFVNGEIKTLYSGQISLLDEDKKYNWLDVDSFRSYLTAYQINNPSNQSLYSLNSARIDFVPYQFRPALKLLHSDEPRILIADSVGVGKTIEAGLIIKELQARNDIRNILIICPKPLVVERKWELEMKRFDEDFTAVTGPELRSIISDADTTGEWPAKFNKLIIPYSALDERTYKGNADSRTNSYGLLDLDPEPHFDLVIVDEAHHIRTGSMEKVKAYQYKCVKYFCDRSDAVVMLTATPLQTSDDDLFTLLNILRPDMVIDKETFAVMSRPNAGINKCLSYIRAAREGWQDDAANALAEITSTQWGEDVISRNPVYRESLRLLEQDEISREERVKLISDIESLHSFNSIINRTRRRDIQDFCVRRPDTIEVPFTPEQQELHDELLAFEEMALGLIHKNIKSIPFMMSTIKRQAASCIFGLAPHIEDWINRRLDVVDDEVDYCYDAVDLLRDKAELLLKKANALPIDDPKFEAMMKVVLEKQGIDNNKIILFSEFKYTLAYLKKKLKSAGIRVEQIDGGVKDNIRQDYRTRFELPKSEPEAIDMLLFTEVGSEGLDYQFCDMMINYDLPWNPMKIEQRIGRIDRRGQISDVVHIYNTITSGTVDADIYHRCFERIGLFNESIGECDEILGEIAEGIENIVIDSKLTDEERNRKLEQMADNEVRKKQELDKLEEEEREFFGFDVTEFSTTQAIQNAENPWISKKCLQMMVDHYLQNRIGKGTYILGEGEVKKIRLSGEARQKLKEDSQKLKGARDISRHKWEHYLKGTEMFHAITFDSEAAERNRDAFFITTIHPLVRQAAASFSSEEKAYLRVQYASDEIEKGNYYFSIYSWKYIGTNPHVRIVTVCENEEIAAILPELIQESQTVADAIRAKQEDWDALDNKQLDMWDAEKQNNQREVEKTASYKIESLQNNFNNKKRSLERKIAEAESTSIRRMYSSELNSAQESFEYKYNSIMKQAKQTDIHSTLLANGIIEIV